MCLNCGYYNGRQVMDLEAEKVKRDARITAKEERIKAEVGMTAPEVTETKEAVKVSDTHKEAREENSQSNRPEKKRESK